MKYFIFLLSLGPLAGFATSKSSNVHAPPAIQNTATTFVDVVVDGSSEFQFNNPTYVKNQVQLNSGAYLKTPFIQALTKEMDEDGSWGSSSDELKQCLKKKLSEDINNNAPVIPAEAMAILCSSYPEAKYPERFHGNYMMVGYRNQLSISNPGNKKHLMHLFRKLNGSTEAGPGLETLIELTNAHCTASSGFTAQACSKVDCGKNSGYDRNYSLCSKSKCPKDQFGQGQADIAHILILSPVGLDQLKSKEEMENFFHFPLSDKQYQQLSQAMASHNESEPICMTCPPGAHSSENDDCLDAHGCSIYREAFNPRTGDCSEKECSSAETGTPQSGCHEKCSHACKDNQNRLNNFQKTIAQINPENPSSLDLNQMFFSNAGIDAGRMKSLASSGKLAQMKQELLSAISNNIQILENTDCSFSEKQECPLDENGLLAIINKYLKSVCPENTVAFKGECKAKECVSCYQNYENFDALVSETWRQTYAGTFGRIGSCSHQDLITSVDDYRQQTFSEFEDRSKQCESTRNSKLCDFHPSFDLNNLKSFMMSRGLDCANQALSPGATTKSKSPPGVR